jgi:hypothetical protein
MTAQGRDLAVEARPRVLSCMMVRGDPESSGHHDGWLRSVISRRTLLVGLLGWLRSVIFGWGRMLPDPCVSPSANSAAHAPELASGVGPVKFEAASGGSVF